MGTVDYNKRFVLSVVGFAVTSILMGCGLPTLPGNPRPHQFSDVRTIRRLHDQPDQSTSRFVIHPIYFVPRDAIDLGFDTTGVLTTSLRRMNQLLADETGGMRLRIDEFGGMPDITFFRSRYSAGVRGGRPGISYDSIVRELQEAGFTTSNRIYAVYVAGPPPSGRYCGMARSPGMYAVVWMQECGYPSPQRYSALRRRFWQLMYFPTGHPWKLGAFNYVDISMLHEILHSLGHVDGAAPRKARTFHVRCSIWQRIQLFAGKGDLMQDCGGGLRLDPTHRFYFRHGRVGCPDLARSVYLDPTPRDPQLPPPQVVTLRITGSSFTVLVGERARFKATSLDSTGSVVPCQGVPAWSSTSPRVATVDADGVVTGIAPGESTLKAAFPQGSGVSVSIRVQAGP